MTGDLKDAFINDLKKGRYAAAFTNYGNKVDELMTYYEKKGEAYDPSKEFSFGAGAVAAIISFLIGGGVKKGMIASMSNVTNAVEAGQYLKRDTFNLIGSNDRYLYTHTTVVPKAKSRDNDSKILQKSCRQKKQAASKKDIACFLFHVERSLN